MPKRTILVAFRLPPDMVARLDAYAKTLEARTPGVRVSRAAALRVLVEIALAGKP